MSAFFYRGHSPNLDFFDVRPEAKLIKEGYDRNTVCDKYTLKSIIVFLLFRLRPKVTFDEYLDMHEYQNIISRMLGADSFPYRNITVDEKVNLLGCLTLGLIFRHVDVYLQVFKYAQEALEKFAFIGIQEVFDFSVKVFLHEIGRANETIEIVNERDQGNAKHIVKQKSDIKKNSPLMDKAYRMNDYDVKLYKMGISFCVIHFFFTLYQILKY